MKKPNYDYNKPCPHCGGDPKIMNPTGYCIHFHYPEDVNKNLIVDMLPQLEWQFVTTRSMLERQLMLFKQLDRATPAKMDRVRRAVQRVENLICKMSTELA